MDSQSNKLQSERRDETLTADERVRFLNAIQLGEKAIKEGRVRPAEEFFAESEFKYQTKK